MLSLYSLTRLSLTILVIEGRVMKLEENHLCLVIASSNDYTKTRS